MSALVTGVLGGMSPLVTGRLGGGVCRAACQPPTVSCHQCHCQHAPGTSWSAAAPSALVGTHLPRGHLAFMRLWHRDDVTLLMAGTPGGRFDGLTTIAPLNKGQSFYHRYWPCRSVAAGHVSYSAPVGMALAECRVRRRQKWAGLHRSRLLLCRQQGRAGGVSVCLSGSKWR